ncbi:MAG: ABC transporter permease subunit [Anaerolineales bacterium]|nr:ABC transporter permease subunit [Anaerolineales bacterium]
MSQQTVPHITQPVGNSAFQLVQEKGWQRGLGNLHRSEFRRWFGTNMWLWMAVIWTAIFNFILAGMVWRGQMPYDEAYTLYCVFGGLFPQIATIIIMQDVLVGEKETGTAAWILSKPVDRKAFVISKFIPNSIGVLLTMVLIPGLVAYIHISVATGVWISPLRLLGGLSVLGLNQLFYLTLSLMLGAVFNNRAAVIAIPMAFAFGQQYILSAAPFLANVLPWSLAISLGDPAPQAVAPGILVATPFSPGPVWFALVCIVIFVAVALWRFEKTEF